jgi:hypothetical protein
VTSEAAMPAPAMNSATRTTGDLGRRGLMASRDRT